MNQEPFSNYTSPEQPKPSRKKWIIIVIGAVILIAAIVIAAVMMNRPKEAGQNPSSQPEVSKEYAIKPVGEAVSYAGTKVHDACSLISFETIRKNIDGYNEMLETIGTDKRPTDPLAIERGYIDRNIPAPLGRDGETRIKNISIGGGTNDTQISSFMTAFDSNCWYGQGEGISIGKGKTFVKTYVIQKPTPINGALADYINSLQPVQSEKGVNVYVEAKRDNANFATVFAVNAAKDTVAIFKTGSQKIADSAAADLIKALSEAPRGPMEITYPKPWNMMPNPCTLLTADDFQRYTGKPATALASDDIYLTDIGDGHMKRTCQRLEVERLNAGEISESNVSVRVAKSVDDAKAYTKGFKADTEDFADVQDITPGVEGADETYATISGVTRKRFAIEMRIAEKILTVNVLGEAGQEADANAYIQRMLPIAKDVVSRLK